MKQGVSATVAAISRANALADTRQDSRSRRPSINSVVSPEGLPGYHA